MSLVALSGEAIWPRLSTSYPMCFSQSKALVIRLAAPGVNAFLVLVVFFVTLSLDPGKHVLPSPLHTPHLSTTALEPMTPSQPTFCTYEWGKGYVNQLLIAKHSVGWTAIIEKGCSDDGDDNGKVAENEIPFFNCTRLLYFTIILTRSPQR